MAKINTIKPSSSGSLSVAFFILIFIAVNYVPRGKAFDVMGPQWLYLGLVNLALTLYWVVKSQSSVDTIYPVLLKSMLARIYLALFIIAGISLFFAINLTEGLVNYARFIITFISFVNISILLNGRIQAFKLLAYVICALAFFQSVALLTVFFKGIGELPLDQLILSLKANTGNKNILAAWLVIQVSFILYCIYISGFYGRLMGIPTLILATICIFIVNARASFLGLFLEVVIYACFCFVEFKRSKDKSGMIKNSLSVLLPLVFAFLLSQLIMSNAAMLSPTPSSYGSVVSRLETITSETNGSNRERLTFWMGAADYISKHPLFGCGYGNWKIASVPYEKDVLNEFLIGKHAHNDFLEITAETGLPGGILYVLIFVLFTLNTFRIYRSDVDQNIKIIAVFLLIALSGYSIDSMFNFPSERPVMQVFFVLLLAAHISCYNLLNDTKLNSKNSAWSNGYLAFSIVLLSGASYLAYQANKASIAESSFSSDFGTAEPKLKAAHIDSLLTDIPNLTQFGLPYNAVKAWYYYKDGNAKKALNLLNSENNANPNLMINEYLKASAFEALNNLDSAYYYANLSFTNKPRNFSIYELYCRIAAKKSDTAAIRKAFYRYIKYRNEPAAWVMYGNVRYYLSEDPAKIVSFFNDGLKIFPGNSEIQKEKYNIIAREAFSHGNIDTAVTNFSKIVAIEPFNWEAMENVGLCYVLLRDYKKAIPYLQTVVNSKRYTNGKSEYLLGVSLQNTGKTSEGCALLIISQSRNYPSAAKAIAEGCK